MILYRPVGLQELALIYDSDMRAFPARLPQQPIFYPVLQLEYARQIASDWNARSGGSAGYVTEFKVEDQYIGQFEKHTVGSSQHQEFWIPAEDLEEFNKHIVGHIKVLEAYFGDTFEGFVPDQFGLQGKNAVEQFTLLANSYLYKRMDFYLEIKRNHKAVFLNYPFWQVHEFKNPGLKEKIIKAIKEGWFASFPKNPLVNPVPAEIAPEKQTDTKSLVNVVDEDVTTAKPRDSKSSVNAFHRNVTFAKETDPKSSERAVHKDNTPVKSNDSHSLARATMPVKQTGSQPLVDSDDEEDTLEEQTDSDFLEKPIDENMREEEIDSPSLVNPVQKDSTLVEQTDAQISVNPLHDHTTPVKQIASHFSQGIELGINGKYHEAIDELTRAVEEDPDDVVAHTSLGVAFHRLGEDERALSCYEAALKIDPNHAEAHYFRANILYRQGNVRDAMAGFTVAIGLAPDLIEAHRQSIPQDRLTDYSGSAAEIRRIAKPARGILDLNKSLEPNPRQANLFKERAAEYYRLWNYEQAISDYSSSLAIQPDDAGAFHARGVAYEQLRRFDRAMEDYKRAAAIDPQLSDAYLNRGVKLGSMGQFRQSIDSLNEGIRLAPNNPDGYFNRGMSYFQLAEFENAIADFSIVIQLLPNDAAAYYWRGISNEAAGRRDEAIADYQQFLALSQDPSARQGVEQKLIQWKVRQRNGPSSRSDVPDERQGTNPVPSQASDQGIDLYDLIVALGERALNSSWVGSGVDCSGENAEELYASTDQNRPVQGRDFLHITSGIRQTVQGDFTAFDPDAASHWIFIRAWDGNGFYIETNDHKSRERLKTQFPSMEDVEGAVPPYMSLFIRI